MKLKIKVKRINKNIPLPEVIDKGDWIDLRAAETVTLNAPQANILKRHKVKGVEERHRDVEFDTKLIKLGVAMELPAGYEAQVLPRSGAPKLNIFQTNSEAVIDNSFNGENDEWRYWMTALADTTINEGDRICQFRIQLSQKATVWQKIKWLLSSGVEIVEVDELGNPDREGIGSTGIK